MDVKKTIRQWWWHQTDDFRMAIRVFVSIMLLVVAVLIVLMAVAIR